MVPETAVLVMLAPLIKVNPFDVVLLRMVNDDEPLTDPLLLNRMESTFTWPMLLLLVVFAGVPENTSE